MNNEYIEQRDGGYYLTGIRVSLDSVVYAFNAGKSPEAIEQDFPSLKRSQIYGAIAYYLDHKDEVDKYLADTEREFESSGVPMAQADPALWERVEHARAKTNESTMGESRV